MKKIAVLLVDDNEDYNWLLKHFLSASKVAVVAGSFSYDLLLKQKAFQVVPDVAILSVDENLVRTEGAILFLKEQFPFIKILVNYLDQDQMTVKAAVALKADGLIYNALQHRFDVLVAIDRLNRGKKYFGEQQ